MTSETGDSRFAKGRHLDRVNCEAGGWIISTAPLVPRKEEPALARFQQTPSAPDDSEKLVVGLGGVVLGQ